MAYLMRWLELDGLIRDGGWTALPGGMSYYYTICTFAMTIDLLVIPGVHSTLSHILHLVPHRLFIFWT